MDTSEDPGLRGRAFVDALRSLDTTGRCYQQKCTYVAPSCRKKQQNGVSCWELSGTFELTGAAQELPGVAGSCRELSSCRQLSRSCQELPKICWRLSGIVRELPGTAWELPGDSQEQ